MGGFFKAIGRFLKKLIKAILKFLKKFWWIILLVVAIYFAPVIAGYLTSVGAPNFLVSAFTWVGTNITPYLTSLVSWVSSGAGSLLSSAGSWFSSLSLGQQAAVGLGAAALIAPDETAAVIETGIDAIGGAVGTVGGAIGTAITKSPWALLLIGGAAYLLLKD